MNFVEMIFSASSDNSLAEIYILFVKNSILLSTLVIREDVIDKVLLLMSISMPSLILRWQGIQIDFVTFGTKPEFVEVALRKLEQERASWYVYAIPQPSSRKQAIFTACKHHCFTKGRTTFVKTNGAEDKPKGKTVNTKYFVAPLIYHKKPRYVWLELKMSIWYNHFLNRTWTGNLYLLVNSFWNTSNCQILSYLYRNAYWRTSGPKWH